MNSIVNIAIQFLPLDKDGSLQYSLIDKAIEVIQASGMNYQVCPFETVVEGNYEDIMNVIHQMHRVCYESGAEEIISFFKIHSSKNHAVRIQDKTQKYQS
jgi:uncharacterized protein YqgV (UPF0045/DUF77 family)